MEISTNMIATSGSGKAPARSWNIKPFRQRSPHKFRKGDRVWCERERQRGTLNSGPRLRWSDMRPGLNPPSDPKAIPGYDVIFDNGDFGTYLETELQGVNVNRVARISGVAKEHAELVKTVGTVGTIVGAIAGVAGLLLKLFGVLP